MSLDGNTTAKTVLRGKVNNPDKIHGKSAYEIAVINGFEGTEAEWLVSLKGDAYILTEADKQEITDNVSRLTLDPIEQTLDEIIAIQNSLIDEQFMGVSE